MTPIRLVARAVLGGILASALVFAGFGPASAATNCFTFTTHGTSAWIADGSGCSGAVVIPDTVRDGSATYIVEALDTSAFQGNTAISSVVLPSTLSYIGVRAFAASSLSSVSLPDTAVVIDQYAFEDTANLSTITLPTSLSFLGQYAFRGCALTSVVIPASLSEIGIGAFEGCTSLRTVNFPEAGSLRIDSSAFAESGLQGALRIGSAVTVIGSFAFQDVTGITSLVIGDNVTSIVEGAFLRDSALSAVSFPAHSLRWIDSKAFAYTALTSLVIPGTVDTLGLSAFAWIPSLTSLIIQEGVRVVPAGAFEGSGITSVVIPSTVIEFGTVAGFWHNPFANSANLESISVAPSNVKYRSDADGAVYMRLGSDLGSDGGEMLIAFPAARQGAFTVPDSVVYVGDEAFAGAHGLTAITFAPESRLSAILSGAFDNSGIQTVYYPPRLTSVPQYVDGSNAQTSITFIRTASPVFVSGMRLSGRLASRGKVAVGVGSWESDVPVTEAYTWFLCRNRVAGNPATLSRFARCAVIPGARSSSIRLPKAARGRYLVARVAETNMYGTSARYVGSSRTVI